ncbi:signal transduction histidine kinase/phage shock protein PspC (stress-responsive transcriptional regulator) [Arthrobacter pigmenti]|uniref:Signal transduction histidine kinase/phage shock protein PspC (Stress-responsive transcriptional regulator) n=1 Tax=Arthrobacter pigmenti TaxID=271432 RepID=A0A846RVY0_9MICC|nr:ATP-binding protein [Arthrobacter pigmenti]NJC23186.1 signal transduction histidine kinase/phage shock protein PspC (stress-responsive transcriptional regulator) [Arthrobacter pigmenti]
MRPALIRSDDAVIAGVCAGLAAHLGVSLRAARIGMVALALVGGAGLVLYGWLWLLVPTTEERRRGVAQPAGLRLGAPALAGPVPEATGVIRSPGRREVIIGVGLLVVAAAFVAQQLGVNIQWGWLLPVGAVALGAVLAWSQIDEARRAKLMDHAGATRADGLARLAAGLVLVMVGVLILVSGSLSWQFSWPVLLAAGAVLGGVGLVLAPWAVKFWKDLEAERAGRIRETERAEIAAHLHDSVLQTLALIQNRAGSEQDVVRLARAQERELRRWLYADAARRTGNLADSIKAAAAEVEEAYGHPVDVVSVGDMPMSMRQEALVQAAREAMVNAAKHAGGAISVYFEASGGVSQVFVRDRGNGFDLDAVPSDRLGIRESVINRMQRHGGTAGIRSSEAGTEVQLTMPEAEAGGTHE